MEEVTTRSKVGPWRTLSLQHGVVNNSSEVFFSTESLSTDFRLFKLKGEENSSTLYLFCSIYLVSNLGCVFSLNVSF